MTGVQTCALPILAADYVVVKDTYIDQENKTLVSYEVNQAFHEIGRASCRERV